MSPVLVFRHTPQESLGSLGPALDQAGVTWRYATLGHEPLPEFRDDLPGLVVLGGPMNVDEVEAHPFLRDEPAWIARAVEAQVPVLGICLGAQLLAKSQGSRVFAHQRKEIGWYTLEMTAAAENDPLLAGCARHPRVFQWHGDTFELPARAVRLARGQGCPEQAFRLGERAYGLQFHLEILPAVIDDWLNDPTGRCEVAELDYIDPAAIRRETPLAMPALSRLAAQVFGRFARWCAARNP